MTEASPVSRPAIAFIGLGMMGLPMSSRLREAGFQPRGADPAAAARAAFAEKGGDVHATAREAAHGADIVITMLPDGNSVREALLGSDGAVSVMKEGGLVIDMSSSPPMQTRSLGADLERHGIRLLDAPVSGGVKRAVEGTLTSMIGGKAADLESARAVLAAMASTLIHAGPLGSGHAVKALNNYVSAAGLAASCEALIIAETFGIDPAIMVDALNASTGRNNSTEVKLKPYILSGSFASGFSLALMAKDLGMAAELAREMGRPAGGPDRAAGQWSDALTALGRGADHTEIYRYLKTTPKDAP